MKVAKLVYVSLLTRVIVDSEADDFEIMEKATQKLCDNLQDSPMDNLDKIKFDTECPYVIGEEQGLSIGDNIEMPEPHFDGTDSWQYGGFIGRIVKMYEIEGVEYAVVEDGDNECFDIELQRLEDSKIDA